MSKDALPLPNGIETIVNVDPTDSPKITDLIEQLDRDFAETQKSTARRL
ncbi:MAG TPA: hypothetical protein VMH85_14040 [Terriglobales bacterium]|nr:hypothetical protein [Terriglobales bacterium]